MLLSTKNRVQAIETVYRGSVNAAQVRIGEVLRDAVRRNCPALIAVHNHPSGDPTPSRDDVRMTKDLVLAGELLDIDVLGPCHRGSGRAAGVAARGRPDGHGLSGIPTWRYHGSCRVGRVRRGWGAIGRAVNWLDFVILGVLAWFTLSAYMAGLIRETVGLASVILGIIMAGLFHDNVSENLAVLVSEGPGTEIAAYLLIFLVVVVLGFISSLFLRTAAHLLFLGWADRAGGALFGFIKAVLIVQAIVVIFVLQPTLGMDDVIADSVIGAFFLDSTPVVRALLPQEFDVAIRDFRLS